jgi:hypothetical protein
MGAPLRSYAREDVWMGTGEGEWAEGEGDERKGKDRGRGLNEYLGSCAGCGGGQTMGRHLRS